MAENNIKIGGRLHAITVEGVVAGANEILDDNKGQKQSEINAAVDASIEELREGLADAGKVDDVEVNGVSVLDPVSKKASINITASVVADDEPGNPTATATMQDGNINIEFEHVKGERGNGIASSSEELSPADGGTNTFTFTDNDGNEHVLHTRNGRTGAQGDSVLVGQGDLPLAHVLGQDNTKAMSQKGVTDAIKEGKSVGGVTTESVDVAAYSENGDDTWEVSSLTGEFVNTNNPHRSIELGLEAGMLSITYNASAYVGEYGYAFLDDNDNLISGVKTVEDGELEIDVTIPISQGATKFRCCKNTLQSSLNIIIKRDNTKWPKMYNSVGKNSDGWMTQEAVTNAIKNSIDEATAIAETKTESEIVAVYQSGGSKKFNVKADTGELASSSSTAVRAMELNLVGDEEEITYQATAYNGNYGYAFLNAQGVLVQGVKTTSDTIITVDAATPISQGAVKFRCSSAINKDSFNLTIKRKVLTSIKEMLEETAYKESPDTSTIRLTFPTKIVKPNNITESGDAPVVTEKTGCALLRLSADYTKAGKPSKLALFFPGAGDYTTPGSTNFPADMQTCIDYVINCGYSVLMPYAWDTDSACGSFATPYSISNYTKAVRKVCEEYNVEQDGVYVWGRSLGATNVIGFGYLSGIHIKGAAMHSGLVGSFASNNASSGQKTYLVRHVFDDDENYARTTAYLTANLHKIAPYDNVLNGLIDISDDEKVAYLVTNNDPEGGFGAKHRFCPFPLKIWHAPDDANVPYSRAYSLFQSILKTGGRCEFRRMPENYTDEYVETANPHHICDTAAPTADVTTKLGIEMERVPIAYIEMIEFWER